MRYTRRDINRSCIVFLVSLAGCGSAGRDHETGTLSGVVRLGGQPLTEGEVLIINTSLGAGASIPINESGRYQVTVPMKVGVYQVAIKPPPAPPPDEMAQSRTMKSNVPKKYHEAETSGLTLNIEKGANTKDFDL